jgi:hypothetical protein
MILLGPSGQYEFYASAGRYWDALSLVSAVGD